MGITAHTSAQNLRIACYCQFLSKKSSNREPFSRQEIVLHDYPDNNALLAKRLNCCLLSEVHQSFATRHCRLSSIHNHRECDSTNGCKVIRLGGKSAG